ncbi:MAG: DUF4145 domain-containing protein [archaeon]|jgi:hypothetical protein
MIATELDSINAGRQAAIEKINSFLASEKSVFREHFKDPNFERGYIDTLESLEYLISYYPAQTCTIKERSGFYMKKVMGKVKTYILKKDSLLWTRSQENLFIFGFPKEACLVSRAVLEDTLKSEFDCEHCKNLYGVIECNLSGENKALAHKIRKNGNDYAHEKFDANSLGVVESMVADSKSISSAKALNKLLTNLKIKIPEY